jgi:ClpP class serine protease
MLDPFLPEREEDIARLKALQADVHDSFIALVRERRGARLAESTEDLFTGAYWTGRRARELGLIDGLGDVRSVMRARFGEEVDLRLVPEPSRGGLLRRLLPSLASGAGSDGGAPQGLIDPGHVIGALEAKALWGRFGL